jgi:hypothetical protein
MTYFVLAVISVGVGMRIGSVAFSGTEQFVFLIALPAIMAGVENISPYGLDNVLTPLFVAMVLNASL